MVKNFFSIICVLFAVTANAQTDFPLKGFLRTQGTISPGFSLSENGSNIYLHGDLEFYPENHISVRGESYFLVGGSNSKNGIREFTNYFGAVYHFIGNKKFDPYVGFQPGVAIRHYEIYCVDITGVDCPTGYTISPQMSLITGINFYLNKYLHFFGMMRYINGRDASFSFDYPMNEIRFSAGLGWNLRVMSN